MCLFATATGDMAFTLTLYLSGAVIHQDMAWIRIEAAYRHAATWTVTALVGVLLAISFELWAVHIVHRWEYGSMPIIPVIRVGWIPVADASHSSSDASRVSVACQRDRPAVRQG